MRGISIHALLAESDYARKLDIRHAYEFLSTLSLRRATLRRPLWIRLKVFLSTLSLRRATGIIGVFQAVEVNFYPRSPCGERPGAERLPPPRWYFYPRSPCGERRHEYAAGVQTIQFLSTLSLRRATVHLLPRAGGVAISIHALLAESDQAVAVTGGQTAKFLSTLSLRRATLDFSYILHLQAFLSTLSLRRATLKRQEEQRKFDISIHALLAESDRRSEGACCHRPRFLSTLSLRRATWKPALLLLQVLYFYPRSPCGERRGLPVHNKRVQQFLSTLSLRRATRPAAF